MNQGRAVYNFDSVRRYGRRGKGYSIPDNRFIKTTKAFHLLSATAWAGGALAMQALSFLKFTTDNPVVIPCIQDCLHFVDTWVVMPGLAGCIITGTLFSTCTAIGFFRFFWIGFKWCIVCCAGFWGMMFWGPWGDGLITWLSLYSLDAPLRLVRSFILPESMWQGALQLSVIFAMCLISVYRPVALYRRRRYRKRDGISVDRSV